MYHQIVVDKTYYVKQKEITAFKKKMKLMYPQYTFASIVTHLYQFLLNKHELTPDDLGSFHKSEDVVPISSESRQLSLNGLSRRYKPRSSKSDSNIEYIKEEQIPPIFYKKWSAYDPEESPYFDQVLIDKEQLMSLRSRERRLLVYSFIYHGYGYPFLHAHLRSKSRQGKKRYKTVLYSVAIGTMKSVETFLRKANRKGIYSLKQIDFRLPSCLLNCRRYFPEKHLNTFFKCLKTNYLLQTDPAHQNEVYNFYNYFYNLYNKQIQQQSQIVKRKNRKQSQRYGFQNGYSDTKSEEETIEERKIFQQAVKQYKETLTRKKRPSKKYLLEDSRRDQEGANDHDIDEDFLDNLEDYSVSGHKQHKEHHQWSEFESFQEPFEDNSENGTSYSFHGDEIGIIKQDNPAFENILKNVVDTIARKELNPQ